MNDRQPPEIVPAPEGLHDADVLKPPKPETPREVFTRMDADLIRVIEDLAFALIEKGALSLSDLPPQAQSKLLQRRGFRDRWQAHQARGDFIDTLDDSKFGFMR